MTNLLAQAVGCVGMLLVFISYQMNDRRKILYYQIAISVIWVIHFFILGANAAAVINIIGMLRAIVFFFRGRHRWASLPAVPVVFCACSVAATIVTWSGPIDILAVVATSLQTIALWMNVPRHIRLFSLPASPMWMAYDVINRSYVGIITECFVLSSLLIAFWRFDIKKREK